jgi:hypothetical protein
VNSNSQEPIISGMRSSLPSNCLPNKGFREGATNDVIRIMRVMQKDNGLSLRVNETLLTAITLDSDTGHG